MQKEEDSPRLLEQWNRDTRNSVEETPSVHSTSTGRPSLSIRTTPALPPSRTSLKALIPVPPTDPPTNRQTEKRFSSDMGQLNLKDTGDQREAYALHDEVKPKPNSAGV
ncbi:Coiled-coil domain-containing protein SCD2 [Camellia lanceoleosa]|uniref:Coiled-coil domain-containing protein SCD2 n=1 Tax=Camellia lanceoleosa TaxID=1840588 RepID=A0ACC0G5S6_9ERIC|nr:Coiled-coil domain-containing protein SCD2 [Camellia lanceoleosa]